MNNYCFVRLPGSVGHLQKLSVNFHQCRKSDGYRGSPVTAGLLQLVENSNFDFGSDVTMIKLSVLNSPKENSFQTFSKFNLYKSLIFSIKSP